MAGKRILVVDDEPAICTVLADLLSGPEYEVVVARDGKSALECATEHYDAAILDLSLPGCSGLDILKAIKKHNPETAVVIMTAYASMQTAIQALKQGAYDFITKPFDLDEVQLLIERALESGGWNQSKAATVLGIDRKTLRTKIREYGLGDDTSAES